MFGFGKATDPVCGMKVEKKAIRAHGKYFCSQSCAERYGKELKKHDKEVRKGCCCHGGMEQ